MPADLSWKGKSRSGNVPSVIGSVIVLEANAYRKGATIVNDGGTVKYLTRGDAAVVNTGIRLNANGGSYEINILNPWFGAISVACAAAAENINWTEDE